MTSHFFEFVPEEQRDDPNTEFLTADQLESNREYYIYFTTSAGLYRYDINDVVRVVDFYRNTPVIQFVRKGQGMTSITGEKLTESQVTGALSTSSTRTGSTSSTSPRASSGASRRATRSTRSSATGWTATRAAQFVDRDRPRAVRAEHRVRGEARVAAARAAGAQARRARDVPGAAPAARRRGRAGGAGEDPAAVDEHGVRRRASRCSRRSRARWLSRASPSIEQRFAAGAAALAARATAASRGSRGASTTRAYRAGRDDRPRGRHEHVALRRPLRPRARRARGEAARVQVAELGAAAARSARWA